jgi:putative holliday junction resolvase
MPEDTPINPPISQALPALALDVGEARIGLAVCDRTGRFVFGRGYITRSYLARDLAALQTHLAQEGAQTLVVGLPLRTDGADSAQTMRVRDFVTALTDAGFVVALQDERFTTKIAGQSLSGKAKRQDKGLIDEASARAILETWLEKWRRTTAQANTAQANADALDDDGMEGEDGK